MASVADDLNSDANKPSLLQVSYVDNGMFLDHNMPCCVHGDKPAVIFTNTGVFYPSRKAHDEGWMLIRVPKKNRLLRWIARLLDRESYYDR